MRNLLFAPDLVPALGMGRGSDERRGYEISISRPRGPRPGLAQAEAIERELACERKYKAFLGHLADSSRAAGHRHERYSAGELLRCLWRCLGYGDPSIAEARHVWVAAFGNSMLTYPATGSRSEGFIAGQGLPGLIRPDQDGVRLLLEDDPDADGGANLAVVEERARAAATKRAQTARLQELEWLTKHLVLDREELDPIWPEAIPAGQLNTEETQQFLTRVAFADAGRSEAAQALAGVLQRDS